MTKQELAQKVKAKYPQYKDVDDLELADKIIAKYPVYKNQITDEQPNVNAEQPKQEKGLLRKVGDFFTSSTQKFGTTLGNAASVIDPTTRQVREETLQSRQNQADNLLKLASQATDPIKKKKYLEAAKESANASGYDIFNNPEYQKTAKQIAGEAIGTVAEAATFSGLSGSVKAGASRAVTVAQSVEKAKKASKLTRAVDLSYDALKQGGLPYGAVKASEALQDNKNVRGIIKDTASGVVQGTALAMGTNILAKKGKDLINSIKDAKLKKAMEAITPKANELTKKQKEALVKSGNISKQGVFSKAQVTNTKEDLRLADKFKEVLHKGSNQSKVDNINEYIKEKDFIVGEYLRENNAIYSNAQLRNQIIERINNNVIDPTLTDEVKNKMVNQLIARIPKNNLEGLWKGRKAFDTYFKTAFTGNPTLKKELTREVRNAAQDFIESRIIDSKYKVFMKDMSDAYTVIDKILPKATKDLGNSTSSMFAKRHPKLIKAAKLGAYATAAYLGGEKISKSIQPNP